jgi:hypothetical protein
MILKYIKTEISRKSVGLAQDWTTCGLEILLTNGRPYGSTENRMDWPADS